MMSNINSMMLTKPEMTQERINEIRSLIADNPQMGRKALSIEICRIWGWQSPTSQLKDISARDMLRTLDRTGKITLPPPMKFSYQPGGKLNFKNLVHDMEPVRQPLTELLPVRIELINAGSALAEFKSYINQFHYLAYSRTVGENMKYMARDKTGTPLACLLFGSAAWSCADRDRFIGWDKEQRSANLVFLSNNVRCLIFPWVKVFNLASYILALVSRRINGDWVEKYGHNLVCLETFVDERFHGTIYKAANWLHVGRTLGRGRDGGHHYAIMPEKEIYIYPLVKDYRQILQRERCK